MSKREQEKAREQLAMVFDALPKLTQSLIQNINIMLTSQYLFNSNERLELVKSDIKHINSSTSFLSDILKQMEDKMKEELEDIKKQKESKDTKDKD